MIGNGEWLTRPSFPSTAWHDVLGFRCTSPHAKRGNCLPLNSIFLFSHIFSRNLREGCTGSKETLLCWCPRCRARRPSVVICLCGSREARDSILPALLEGLNAPFWDQYSLLSVSRVGSIWFMCTTGHLRGMVMHHLEFTVYYEHLRRTGPICPPFQGRSAPAQDGFRFVRYSFGCIEVLFVRVGTGSHNRGLAWLVLSTVDIFQVSAKMSALLDWLTFIVTRIVLFRAYLDRLQWVVRGSSFCVLCAVFLGNASYTATRYPRP